MASPMRSLVPAWWAVLSACGTGLPTEEAERKSGIGISGSGDARSAAVATAPPISPKAAPATAQVSAQISAPGPATVERVRVPGDLPASLVRGFSAAPPGIVFLPGVCSNANAYLHSFPEAARAHGGVVAIDGDLPCGGDPSFRTFARDIPRQHARIEAALAAAGVVTIPAEGLTLVGYSQGASIGEELALRWPDRYARVVLMGSPKDPDPKRLIAARAVATMSCDRDVPPRMRGAALRLEGLGVPAKYFEMPGCTHGLIGDGERVFAEVFTWLDGHQRPMRAGATPVAIARGIE